MTYEAVEYEQRAFVFGRKLKFFLLQAISDKLKKDFQNPEAGMKGYGSPGQ